MFGSGLAPFLHLDEDDSLPSIPLLDKDYAIFTLSPGLASVPSARLVTPKHQLSLEPQASRFRHYPTLLKDIVSSRPQRIHHAHEIQHASQILQSKTLDRDEALDSLDSPPALHSDLSSEPDSSIATAEAGPVLGSPVQDRPAQEKAAGGAQRNPDRPLGRKSCLSCGKTQSPCWRPAWQDAPEHSLLCNSCGLRWHKSRVRCVRTDCHYVPMRVRRLESIPAPTTCDRCGGDIRQFDSI